MPHKAYYVSDTFELFCVSLSNHCRHLTDALDLPGSKKAALASQNQKSLVAQQAADAYVATEDPLAQVYASTYHKLRVFSSQLDLTLYFELHAPFNDSGPNRFILAQIEVRRRISSRVSISAEGENVAASLNVKCVEAVLEAPLSSHRKGFTEKQCMYVLICLAPVISL